MMSSKRPQITEVELRELYVNQQLSMAEIAQRYCCGESTVRRQIHAVLIPARPRGPKGSKELKVSEAELRALYLEQKLSVSRIAQMYGCAVESVRLRLQALGIPLRSFSQAHLVQHGTNDKLKDFDGDAPERAYLIGFRIGDLTVRKPRRYSEIIFVEGTSTRPEQIQLIRQLFERYGHIHESLSGRLASNGLAEHQIRCTLNTSFEFLLDHPDRVPSWILANEQSFAAFFAGLTDAEGSFNLSKRGHRIVTARFSIKSTDKQILEQCRDQLELLDIHCAKLGLVYSAGCQTSKRGVFATKALWEFSIGSKESLLRLIPLLSPYLRHAKRRRDMESARKNVEWRQSKIFRQPSGKIDKTEGSC